MKELTFDEVKETQLKILDFVDSFCKENNIQYSLCGGTMIGAVRHKGYIPWDDDIDIFMPRPDYEKFCSTFNKESGDFSVINCFSDKQYFYAFAKVTDKKTKLIEPIYDRTVKNLGVYIDLFPVDGLPDDSKKRVSYWKKMLAKRNFSTVVYKKRRPNLNVFQKITQRCFFHIFRILPANFFAKKINKFAMKNDFGSSEYVACSVFGYGRKEEMLKSVFDSFEDVDFEGRKFKALSGWKTYLTNLYGDFMMLPPKEQQVAKHSYKAYWREK